MSTGSTAQPATRVHYLSAQSFIGAEPATGAYYTDVAAALRAHALDPRAQLTELFRRLLFTILVSNNETRIARRITRAR